MQELGIEHLTFDNLSSMKILAENLTHFFYIKVKKIILFIKKIPFSKEYTTYD
jgi:hypothetical protein